MRSRAGTFYGNTFEGEENSQVMVESYFEYTLSQCGESVVSAVCKLFESREQLLETAKMGFNGTANILGQGLLIFAASDFISENGYIASSELSNDAGKLHARCQRNLEKMREDNWQHIDIDREKMFNALVDLNWLFSSAYIHIQGKQEGRISLLTSPTTIRIGIRDGLADVLYNSALYDKDRSEQYETAQLTKYQFFRGMHPDPQVRKMLVNGCTYSDFKELQAQARECSIRRMALFYGLTATAAKAEQIRRMR